MGFTDNMFSKQMITLAYKQFIQNPAEFDEDELFQVFDANYAFPIFADFINNHTDVINVEENAAVVALQFLYGGNTFFAKMYPKNPRVVLITIVKDFDMPNQRAERFCNEVNRIDPIHQVGTLHKGNGKNHLVVTRQIILTPSIGDSSTVELCVNQLSDFANQLAIGQLPKAHDWKKYAMRPRPGILGAEQILFPPKNDNSCLREFSKQCKVLAEDGEKTVHEMIQIDTKKIHTVNCFGTEVNIHTQLIDDYTITTYKLYPYLAVISATINPANYTSQRLLSDEFMLHCCSDWNKAIHFGVSKFIAITPSHRYGNNPDMFKFKIEMTTLLAEDINTYAFYHIIGSMEKAIGYLIKEHRVF